MKIKTKILGMVQTNCYFVSKEGTSEVVLIDPADDTPSLVELLEQQSLKLAGILLTHGHFDHILGVKHLTEAYEVSVYAYEKEKELLKTPGLNLSREVKREYSLTKVHSLQDGERISLAGMEFTVLATPGHTGGSCCYYLEQEGVLFSGDTLFYEEVGRTDLPTGDMEALLSSIQRKLLTLPETVSVYPGHGRSTTIGHEKAHNIYLQ